MITKAIIPVAGWGTRRLPITKAIEKCMLPIGNRPIVDYVVEDCVKAGITDIYFVVSEGSTQLQSYYEDNLQLDTYLMNNEKRDMLPMVKPPQGINFHYVTQPNNGQYGTAVPVGLVVPQLPVGESAVVLMGDDFVYNPDGSSEIKRLIDMAHENGNAMLAARVDPNEVSRYGVFETDSEGGYVQIVEKPLPNLAPSNLINISKYVMNYDLLRAVEGYCSVALSGEYQLIEAINLYVHNEGGSARVIEAQGQYLDGGTVEGWLYANNVVVGSS